MKDRIASISAPDEQEPWHEKQTQEQNERERIRKLYIDDFNLSTNFGNTYI